MRIFNTFLITCAIAVAAAAVLFGVYRGFQLNQAILSKTPPRHTDTTRFTFPTATPDPTPRPTPAVTPIPEITSLLDHDIPFTSQAPFGEWEIETFQDGCEEASILMAMHWVNKVPIESHQAARQAIIDISQFEQDTYGEYRDRSAADTLQLIKDYFKYSGVTFKADVTIQDIKNELASGNILVIPMNGRALANHHYTPPGPERHMLLVRGYDPATREFITNDPGTKFGEAFRFKEQDFFGAIRDYPTGYLEPITSIQKTMIVIHPR